MKSGIHAFHGPDAFDFRQGVPLVFPLAAVNNYLGQHRQDHEAVIKLGSGRGPVVGEGQLGQIAGFPDAASGQGELVVHPGVFQGRIAIGDAAFLQPVYDGRVLLIADSRVFYEGGVIGNEEKIGVMVQAVSPVLDICADAVHYDDIVAEGEIFFHFRTVAVMEVADVVR